MGLEETEVTFPPADFVRRGPPLAVRDLHRQNAEKWSRVALITPRARGTAERTRYDFMVKGPYTLPLAVRRKGVELGSRLAWQFFTHPYAVFPEDAVYFNVPGKGCLGARLFVRAQEGVRIYDEVGAGMPQAETVTDSYQGALGVFRHRILGGEDRDLSASLALELLELDLDLLEVFYLSTLLLKSMDPVKILLDLYPLLKRPTLHRFAWDAFGEEDHDLMVLLKDGVSVSAAELGQRFRVSEDDFTKITDVRDARGRQAILELLDEFKAFERQHAARIRELSAGIAQEERKLEEIKTKVRRLQEENKERSRVTRLFSRSDRTIKELKAEAVHAIRAKRAQEEAFSEIPGYDRVRGLTDRVKGFQETIASIYRLARDLTDHNVTRSEVNSLRALLRDKIRGSEPEAAKRGYRQYDLRLRAEILPKLLSTYSISSYVLRRAEAIQGEASLRNLRRVHTLARYLIDYFSAMRYGPRTLGEAFDETWGQVLNIEGQL